MEGGCFYALGDVSGKGVSASLFMVAARAAIGNAAESCTGIADIAGQGQSGDLSRQSHEIIRHLRNGAGRQPHRGY